MRRAAAGNVAALLRFALIIVLPSALVPEPVKEGVMKKVYELGKLRVTVEMPDVPEGVEVTVDLDIRTEAAGEAAARATIEALGGVGVLEDVNVSAGSTGYLKLKGSDFRTLEATVWAPTGRERPLPESPFLRELRDEQRELVAPEAS